MRIAVVGKMRSGKDTIADILTVQYGFRPIAFADGIKEIVEKYFPEALESGKPREHYQYIGQTLRQLNPSVWINTLDRRVNQLIDTPSIVTDCRQINESHYLRDNDYMIIKVIATDEIRLKRIFEAGEKVTYDQFEHDTEKQVDVIVADFVIINNSTYEELEVAVECAYQYYIKYFIPDRKYRRQLEVHKYESK